MTAPLWHPWYSFWLSNTLVPKISLQYNQYLPYILPHTPTHPQNPSFLYPIPRTLPHLTNRQNPVCATSGYLPQETADNQSAQSSSKTTAPQNINISGIWNFYDKLWIRNYQESASSQSSQSGSNWKLNWEQVGALQFKTTVIVYMYFHSRDAKSCICCRYICAIFFSWC